MASETTTEKKLLRKRALAIRQNLDMDVSGRAICARIANHPAFVHADAILAYSPVRGELNLLALMSDFPQKRWYLSRILPGNGLAFHRYAAGDPLTENRYGIPEPLESAEPFDAGPGALMLVPGLMFDTEGHRLGYGKGFYDRLLQDMPGTVFTMGAVPDALLVPRLPRDAWDRPVDCVVTETAMHPPA